MFGSYYIIRFKDIEEYKIHKDKLGLKDDLGLKNLGIIHYLTDEEYEKIKPCGLNITHWFTVIPTI